MWDMGETSRWVHRGGIAALSKNGWQAIGAEKSTWAKKIAPHMNPGANLSPSFQYFRKKMIELAEATP